MSLPSPGTQRFPPGQTPTRGWPWETPVRWLLLVAVGVLAMHTQPTALGCFPTGAATGTGTVASGTPAHPATSRTMSDHQVLPGSCPKHADDVCLAVLTGVGLAGLLLIRVLRARGDVHRRLFRSPPAAAPEFRRRLRPPPTLTALVVLRI